MIALPCARKRFFASSWHAPSYVSPASSAPFFPWALSASSHAVHAAFSEVSALTALGSRLCIAADVMGVCVVVVMPSSS